MPSRILVEHHNPAIVEDEQTIVSEIPHGTPLWAKVRGEWQAAITSGEDHCLKRILKCRPLSRHRKYHLIFLPQSQTFTWIDSGSIQPVSEHPIPLDHESVTSARASMADPDLPRKFAILSLGEEILDISDCLHVQAVAEVARTPAMWHKFAERAARAETYEDLGRLLVDTYNVILGEYIEEKWLLHSCAQWTNDCLNAATAEAIYSLNQALLKAVRWEEAKKLWLVKDHPVLVSDWSTWKEPWNEAYGYIQTMAVLAMSKAGTGQRGPSADSSLTADVSSNRSALAVARQKSAMKSSKEKIGRGRKCSARRNGTWCMGVRLAGSLFCDRHVGSTAADEAGRSGHRRDRVQSQAMAEAAAAAATGGIGIVWKKGEEAEEHEVQDATQTMVKELVDSIHVGNDSLSVRMSQALDRAESLCSGSRDIAAKLLNTVNRELDRLLPILDSMECRSAEGGSLPDSAAVSGIKQEKKKEKVGGAWERKKGIHCTICLKEFRERHLLKHHLRLGKCGERQEPAEGPSVSRMVSCRLCGALFSVLTELGVHYKKEHPRVGANRQTVSDADADAAERNVLNGLQQTERRGSLAPATGQELALAEGSIGQAHGCKWCPAVFESVAESSSHCREAHPEKPLEDMEAKPWIKKKKSSEASQSMDALNGTPSPDPHRVHRQNGPLTCRSCQETFSSRSACARHWHLTHRQYPARSHARQPVKAREPSAPKPLPAGNSDNSDLIRRGKRLRTPSKVLSSVYEISTPSWIEMADCLPTNNGCLPQVISESAEGDLPFRPYTSGRRVGRDAHKARTGDGSFMAVLALPAETFDRIEIFQRKKLHVVRKSDGPHSSEDPLQLKSSSHGQHEGDIGHTLLDGSLPSNRELQCTVMGGIWGEGHLEGSSDERYIICRDLSGGMEPVPVPCVVDSSVLSPCDCPSCRVSGMAADVSQLAYAPPSGFEYVVKRTLDPRLGLNPKDSLLSCQCEGAQCLASNCDHVSLFAEDSPDACDVHGESMAGRFSYSSTGKILVQENYLVYECNSECRCSVSCQNRVLQRGVRVRLEVFLTHHKGWAVRAAERIEQGSFVCEYIGEVIDDKEAHKRGVKYDKEGISFLYDIDSHIDTNIPNRQSCRPFVIDATKCGNVSRFINHSCAPNLVNYQVLVESMDYQLAHIGLFAARDIWPGDELSYDYHYKLLPGNGVSCHCGAPTCRGRLY